MKYAAYALCVNTRFGCSDFGLARVLQKEQTEGVYRNQQ